MQRKRNSLSVFSVDQNSIWNFVDWILSYLRHPSFCVIICYIIIFLIFEFCWFRFSCVKIILLNLKFYSCFKIFDFVLSAVDCIDVVDLDFLCSFDFIFSEFAWICYGCFFSDAHRVLLLVFSKYFEFYTISMRFDLSSVCDEIQTDFKNCAVRIAELRWQTKHQNPWRFRAVMWCNCELCGVKKFKISVVDFLCKQVLVSWIS